MSQQARAVLSREVGKPVVVETIVVESPHHGEVMIKLAACGVCHSDLSATNGTIPFPMPVVLGHEGAGVVVEVGTGVTDYAVGDHVVSSFVSMCGKCRYCQTGRPQLLERPFLKPDEASSYSNSTDVPSPSMHQAVPPPPPPVFQPGVAPLHFRSAPPFRSAHPIHALVGPSGFHQGP